MHDNLLGFVSMKAEMSENSGAVRRLDTRGWKLEKTLKKRALSSI
jgi:hypothetical protein